MTNNELLLAISDMFDKKLEAKLDAKLKPIENKLQQIEERMTKLEECVSKLEIRVSKLEERMTKLEERVTKLEERVSKIEIDLLENNVIPRLNTIESCYTDTYNRYKNGVSQIDAMQDDIDIMKTVVTEHSVILQQIS